MWNIEIILLLIATIALFIFSVFELLWICFKKDNKEDIQHKCPNCGNEFVHNPKNIITFKFKGKLQKMIECPKCKNLYDYVE